jgi:quinolinate synthase
MTRARGPDKWMSPVPEIELREQIRARKEALGKELLILTHHYQRKEIVDLGDYKGDSFGLSRKAAAAGAEGDHLLGWPRAGAGHGQL